MAGPGPSARGDWPAPPEGVGRSSGRSFLGCARAGAGAWAGGVWWRSSCCVAVGVGPSAPSRGAASSCPGLRRRKACVPLVSLAQGNSESAPRATPCPQPGESRVRARGAPRHRVPRPGVPRAARAHGATLTVPRARTYGCPAHGRTVPLAPLLRPGSSRAVRAAPHRWRGERRREPQPQSDSAFRLTCSTSRRPEIEDICPTLKEGGADR